MENFDPDKISGKSIVVGSVCSACHLNWFLKDSYSLLCLKFLLELTHNIEIAHSKYVKASMNTQQENPHE